MRLLFTAVSFIFALGVLLPADTSSDFSKRYGSPICETYLVRPAIVASVSYGKSGQACEIVVSPNQSGEPIKSRNTTINSQQLTEVLDEIVPVEERGKMRMGIFAHLTCWPSLDCEGTQTIWDTVEIYRNGGDNNEHYATIQWNRDECHQKIDDSHAPNPLPPVPD
jgi:hypothetical protein